MRVNIYAEEITNEVSLVETVADTGKTFYGIRFFLSSSDRLHYSQSDDDRSSVTFWIPINRYMSPEDLADTFSRAGDLILTTYGTETE